MRCRNFVSGCAGGALSSEEIAFFEKESPWGLILFARNCQSRQQVSKLTADFRTAVNRPDAPVMIDEEGGRVQRLKPPHWPSYPAGRVYGKIYERDPDSGRRAAWLGGRLIAHDLAEVGVTINCLPVLDLPIEGVSDVVGDRAYSRDTTVISTLASAACEGMMAGGVLPVMKHIPGHGRSLVDSHLELPVVHAGHAELQADFAPFKKLRDLPFAMTAHLVYTAIDDGNPATTSKTVISDIIRDEIGFSGCLFSDDISMQALHGTISQRVERVLAAGCDIALHCNGTLDEMKEAASVSEILSGEAADRAQRGLNQRKVAEPIDSDVAREELSALLKTFTAVSA